MRVACLARLLPLFLEVHWIRTEQRGKNGTLDLEYNEIIGQYLRVGRQELPLSRPPNHSTSGDLKLRVPR